MRRRHAVYARAGKGYSQRSEAPMVPLDSFPRWSPRLDGCARIFLSAAELARYESIPAQERQRQLGALLDRPLHAFSMVNEAYFRARWGETLGMLHPDRGIAVLEVATGDADMIPQAMARSHAGGRYVTANMNRAANRSLLAKTAGLDLARELLEDDAANIERHSGPEAFDVIAFQHGMNDVAQAILCGREGIDTTDADWMETLPRMIGIIRREVASGTLEDHVKPGILALMRPLIRVLKRGGTIAINHYMFQLDLDWGYPPGLWAGFVPLVREWLRGMEGVEEARFNGYEPNWWMFLRKA
jgi:hypothetical protein